MYKIILSVLLCLSIVPSALAIGEGERIELAITPIKKEIQIAPGGVATGSVTLYNNSDASYVSMMGSEDCTSSNQFGTPDCLATITGSIDSRYLSTWITYAQTGTFTIPPHKSYTMNYRIQPPANTQPGWYYAGIIFKNMKNPIMTSGTIGMNRRIQSLILVTILGDMIVDPEFGSIQIDTHGGATDSLPKSGREFFNFSQTGTLIQQLSKKWEKLMMVFTDPIVQKEIIDYINPFWETPILESAGPEPTSIGQNSNGVNGNDRNNTLPLFSLTIPIDNKGTIHITPTGQITLHELDGTQLLNIGREFIKNENGAIVSEKVVNYLTINAEGGAVLPKANRLFEINWLGFGHESINPDRSISVVYENPGAYYARTSREESGFLYPWQKLVLTHTIKQLIAKVNLSYMNPITRSLVDRNQEVPITVEYDEVIKTVNTGLVFIISIILLFLWWIIVWRRRSRRQNNNIVSAGNDEIAVLERARAILFAKEANRAVSALKSKTAVSNSTGKVTDTLVIKKVITKKTSPNESVATVIKKPRTKVTKPITTTETL